MLDATTPAGPPSVVLDTNAVLDWLVFVDQRTAQIAAAVKGRHVLWLVSARMREEFAAVLARPPIATRLPGRSNNSELALTAFDRHSVRRTAPPSILPGLLCADPDDQIFVDLALAEKARWLITRDKALLALRKRALARGLLIAPPDQWRPADALT